MTRWRRRGHEPTSAERRAHFPHIEDVISGAGQAGQHRSNMAIEFKRFRAAAHMGELRRKLLKIYPLRFRPGSVLSSCSPVGNLGGNFQAGLCKLLNLRRKWIRFPLPGTNKNNKLTFISILFLECLPQRRRGGYGGERWRSSTVRAVGFYPLFVYVVARRSVVRQRAGRTVPDCSDEVIRSLKSGEEATVYLLASADRSPCPERCGIRELSLERHACEPAQATASSSRRRPALQVTPTPVCQSLADSSRAPGTNDSTHTGALTLATGSGPLCKV
jgi:hypothetical protein